MEKPGSEKFNILLRTKLFSIEIIKLCDVLNKKKVEYYLRDQLGRSGTSIGANLHEGKYSSSPLEFCRYYQIALKSGYEAMYWLDVLEGSCKINEINKLKLELIEIIKIITSIILKIKAKLRLEKTKQK